MLEVDYNILASTSGQFVQINNNNNNSNSGNNGSSIAIPPDEKIIELLKGQIEIKDNLIQEQMNIINKLAGK